MPLFPPRPQPQPEPVPVPIPPGELSAESGDAPVKWRSGEKTKVHRYWRFIRWMAARERRDWPDMMQAPLEISPGARYHDAS